MKTTKFLTIMLLLMTAGCGKNTRQPAGQDPVKGKYAPEIPIVMMLYDIRETGAELGGNDYSGSYQNVWTWNNRRQLTCVDYDVNRVYYTDGPVRDEYSYDNNGRLEKIMHYAGGNLQRTFDFSYSEGRLDDITFDWGQDGAKNRTRFIYRSGDQQPCAIAFIRPVESWLENLYHTDTLVQVWTLEWDNGNLVRATTDSMAWYCTGISHIEYLYDNRYNPMQGFFSADLISQNAFIDNPFCLSRNNLTKRITYHYNRQDDTTTVNETDFTYTYRDNDGFPASVSNTVGTLIWTERTTAAHFIYGEHTNNE